MSRSVVLIGFMGSGKSTLGRALSKRMGQRFVDLDERIEHQEGLTVAAIFSKHGEKGFREVERKVLLECLSEESPMVLACGGGTPCQPGLLEALLSWGEVVYLDVPLDVLRKRSLPGRPLWNEAVDTLYSERQSIYQQAPIHLDGTLPPEILLEAAVRGLELRR